MKLTTYCAGLTPTPSAAISFSLIGLAWCKTLSKQSIRRMGSLVLSHYFRPGQDGFIRSEEVIPPLRRSLMSLIH